MSVIFNELINSFVSVTNCEDAIRKTGKILYDNGFVKDTYVDAVVAREKDFPTGLQLKEIAVAIPHTDCVHVYKPGICITRLNKPITFIHMGEFERCVDVEIIFMMAIQNPSEQIDTLKRMVQIFSNEDVVRKFKDAKTNDQLFKVAKQYLDEE